MSELAPTVSPHVLTAATSAAAGESPWRVVAVPQVLVDIYPDYRGHMYFVVGDEIIIVDRNHRIIAVIAV